MGNVRIAAAAAALLLGLAGSARAQEAARTAIERAIQAHGGAAVIDKRQAVQAKAKSVLSSGGLELPVTQETYIQLPDKFKIVTEISVAGTKTTMVQVLNGDKGWLRFNDMVQPANDDLLKQMKEMQHVERVIRLTPLLRDRNFELESLGEVKLDGKPVLGVKVAHKGFSDVKLYFDKGTGLLSRSERKTQGEDGKESVEEQVYSDFKDVQGAKVPMKVLILKDGKKFLEGEMVEVKPVDRLDDSVFDKPS